MTAQKTYYITTPIYYVNDAPHIGHAYTTLACDVLARFKRLDGYKVKFLTGTDEHGQKVEKSAILDGKDPKTFTDIVSQNFQELAKFMNFTNDDFIRTTEKRHLKACQRIWETLVESGAIYLGSYSGWYAIRDEAFYNETELKSAPNGKRIAPSGAEVEWIEEPSYFFRLSAWQEKLLEFYEQNPNFVQPKTRRNEVLKFVEAGLQDLSISRTTFSWGVPVPGDSAHIIYVWLDALTNYITAVGYPDIGDETQFRRFWPADIHMVGKDILRFHAVYWPAFLMAANIAVPRTVFAHGWWTNEGEKISKSLGNIIDPFVLVKKYGLDQVRYFLMREVPFGNDGDFSHQSMVNRINSELANDYGNLVQRVLSMIAKNCDNKIPTPAAFTDEDKRLMIAAEGILLETRDLINDCMFHECLEAIWRVIRSANGYIDRQAPWKLRKENPKRMETVLYTLVESIRRIAIFTQPFMPDSSSKILDLVGAEAGARGFDSVSEEIILTPGKTLPIPRGVFPRYQESPCN